MDIPTLETARLRLLTPVSRHFDAFAVVFAEPDFVKHLGIQPRDRETSHRGFCALLGHWRLRGWGASSNTASIRVAEKLGASHERDTDLHGTRVRVYAHTLST